MTTKSILKCLPLLLLLFFINCQKDDEQIVTEIYQEGRFHRITLDDLSSRLSSNEDYKQLSKLFDVNRDLRGQHENRLDVIDEPWIMTDEIIMIERGDKAFYTFRIGTTTTHLEFYNLVVAFDDLGDIRTMRILEYTPSNIWLEDDSQPFSGTMKLIDNTFFTSNDISNLFNLRSGISDCVIGVEYEWECNYNQGHAPGEGTSCTSWELIFTLVYGPCPESIDAGDSADGGGFTVGGDGTSGSGGTTDNDSNGNNNGNNNPPSDDEDCIVDANGNCMEDETTVMPPKDIIPPDPCELISKLENDNVFKQNMNILTAAADVFDYELVITVNDDINPSPADNYEYNVFEGDSGSPFVTYTYNSNIEGLVHSHFSGLLSIFSPKDLRDLYQIMSEPEVGDDFFYGVVTDSGTAYILQIEDRTQFLNFGYKYLSTFSRFKDFEKKTVRDEYNIKPGNTTSGNEKGFVQMMGELGAGINVYKPTDGTFSDYKKLEILNGQLIETDCN